MKYQYFLKSVDALVGYGHAVYLANLVADVKSRLPVNHASMHDARHNAASIFCNLQRNALEEEYQYHFFNMVLEDTKKKRHTLSLSAIHRSASMLTTM
jgi:hypothetical protein